MIFSPESHKLRMEHEFKTAIEADITVVSKTSLDEEKQGEVETKTLSPASTWNGSRISMDSEEERCLMSAGRGTQTTICKCIHSV